MEKIIFWQNINLWMCSAADMMHVVAYMMCDAANMMHGVAYMMAEWSVVGKPG